uniref:Reverse transcriptase domain-containing protein n=1 Tax=Haemonchus contortus TaxID=6289 RepID=A0A7I4YFU4_HAECO
MYDGLHDNNTHCSRPNGSNRCHCWDTSGTSSELVPLPARWITELVDEPLKSILYADGIARIAESKEEFQDKLQKWQIVLAGNGHRLNVKKTKLLSSKEGTESIVDRRGPGRKIPNNCCMDEVEGVHWHPLRPSVL